MVPYETPWAVARSMHITRRSALTSAATADVLSPLGLFRVQMPQIVGGFAGLNFLLDVVDSGFRQGLVPKSGVSKNFYFICAFSGSGKVRHEITDLRHSVSWQG